MTYTDEQKAEAVRLLVGALSDCRDGEANWDRIDPLVKALFKTAEVSPWDVIGIVSNRSLAAWFDELPPAPPVHGPVVYVIGGVPDTVKIGFTTHLPNRLAVLQSSTPWKLEVEAVLGGTRTTEALLHRRFAADRISGEWFRRSDQIFTFIWNVNRVHPLVDA